MMMTMNEKGSFRKREKVRALPPDRQEKSGPMRAVVSRNQEISLLQTKMVPRWLEPGAAGQRLRTTSRSPRVLPRLSSAA